MGVFGATEAPADVCLQAGSRTVQHLEDWQSDRWWCKSLIRRWQRRGGVKVDDLSFGAWKPAVCDVRKGSDTPTREGG